MKFKENDRAVTNSLAFQGAPESYRKSLAGSKGTITRVIPNKMGWRPFDVEFHPDVDWEEGPGPWPMFEDELDLLEE